MAPGGSPKHLCEVPDEELAKFFEILRDWLGSPENLMPESKWMAISALMNDVVLSQTNRMIAHKLFGDSDDQKDHKIEKILDLGNSGYQICVVVMDGNPRGQLLTPDGLPIPASALPDKELKNFSDILITWLASLDNMDARGEWKRAWRVVWEISANIANLLKERHLTSKMRKKPSPSAEPVHADLAEGPDSSATTLGSGKNRIVVGPETVTFNGETVKTPEGFVNAMAIFLSGAGIAPEIAEELRLRDFHSDCGIEKDKKRTLAEWDEVFYIPRNTLEILAAKEDSKSFDHIIAKLGARVAAYFRAKHAKENIFTAVGLYPSISGESEFRLTVPCTNCGGEGREVRNEKEGQVGFYCTHCGRGTKWFKKLGDAKKAWHKIGKQPVSTEKDLRPKTESKE